jgi:hypothetical protein
MHRARATHLFEVIDATVSSDERSASEEISPVEHRPVLLRRGDRHSISDAPNH